MPATPSPVKTIADFTECPHCGGGDYYQMQHYKGVMQYNYVFAPDEEADNGEMHDGLVVTKRDPWFHCSDCKKKICKA